MQNDESPAGPTSIEEWREWGDKDPMFGVATVPGREAHGSTPWTAEEFYAMGAAEVDIFIGMWQRYLGTKPTGDVVEIGCGAGRLSRSLAKFFTRVHGVDVSPGMLKTAAPHMPPNVSMQIGSGTTIPHADQSMDAAFSYIVFQHFDSVEMMKLYFREIFRVLKPGGTIMVHVPAVEPSQRLRQIIGLYTLRRHLTRLYKKLHPAAPLTAKGWVTMNYIMVPYAQVEAALAETGFEKITHDQMPDSDKRSTFYFATKMHL